MAPPWLRAARLDHLRLLRVRGMDRRTFLQGQLTQDVQAVTPASSALFGWTTVQGRLIACGQIFEWQDALWLTVPAETAGKLLLHLQRFVLRARVTLDIAGRPPLGLLDADAPGLAAAPLACIGEPEWFATRLAGDPRRVLAVDEREDPEADAAAGNRALDAWRLADIRTGLPTLTAATSEQFTPQMVNLDLVGGISFSKGCYTGQEIITRTRHLGRIKRRMLRLWCTAGPPPEPGTSVLAGNHEAGHVVSSVATESGIELLAVMQLAELSRPLSAGTPDGPPLTLLPLPYAIPEQAVGTAPVG